MPLYKEIFTSAKSVVGIWRMTESLEQLEAIELSHQDLEIYKTFKIEKRKREWLAVRHALKAISGNVMQIVYNSKRKPTIENSDYSISISHSNNFVAVYINAESEVGIDIEEVRNKILNIKEKFCSEKELEFVSKNNTAAHVTICWSAKESLYKFYAEKKLDFKKHILLNSFELNTHGILFAEVKIENYHKQLKVNYLVDPEFVMTYVADL